MAFDRCLIKDYLLTYLLSYEISVAGRFNIDERGWKERNRIWVV